MKKIFLVVLVVVLTIPMVLAAGLNANETNILNELKSGAKLGNKIVSIPMEYIKQAENYFIANDITDVQNKKILSEISESKAIISTLDISAINPDGTLNVDKIPESAKKSFVQKATNICEEIGLVFTLSGSNVKIVDQTGITVFSGDIIIKNTGANNYALYAFVGIVLLLAVGAILVLTKENKPKQKRKSMY